jgi:hypothetical protein
VDGGSGESTLELVAVSQVTNGNDGVGDRSTNVGSHDHVNTLTDRNRVSSNKRHNDGSCGGRRLKKNGSEDANHESGNGIGFVTKECSGGTSSQNLGSRAEELQSEEEEVKEEADGEKSKEGVSPFFRSVDAASVADLTPGGFLHESGIRRVEILVTDVHGAGGTVLAARGVIGVKRLGHIRFGIGLMRTEDIESDI